MDCPKTLQVGPYVYKVETNYLADETMKAAEVWGDHDIGEQRLRIRSDAGPDCTRDTVLHELLHAIMEVYGIRPKKEERLIRKLSPAILDVFDRNPELLDYLFPESDDHDDGSSNG